MRKIIFLLSILLLLLLSACTSQSSYEVTDAGISVYDTNAPTDALNYTTYINKELDLIMNSLSSHIANGNSIAKGDYIVTDEIDAVAESLDSIGVAIESVEALNPPEEYEDNRLAILRRMQNAEDTLAAYKEALEEGKIDDIGDYVKIMTGDYVSLSGVFSVFDE